MVSYLFRESTWLFPGASEEKDNRLSEFCMWVYVGHANYLALSITLIYCANRIRMLNEYRLSIFGLAPVLSQRKLVFLDKQVEFVWAPFF